MFLLVPAHPSSPGQRAVKRLLCVVAQCHEEVDSETVLDKNKTKLECGPMPNVMAALSNIGGALC